MGWRKLSEFQFGDVIIDSTDDHGVDPYLFLAYLPDCHDDIHPETNGQGITDCFLLAPLRATYGDQGEAGHYATDEWTLFSEGR